MIGVRIALVALALSAGGCALTSKADPIEITYVRPDHVPLGAAGARRPLRIDAVSSGEALGRTLLTVEGGLVRPSESLQWTEIPAIYVKRALGRTLFEAEPGQLPGFRRDLGRESPRLKVELLRFEWAKRPKAGGPVRVECRFTLWKGDRALLERTILTEANAADPSQLGRAFAEALAALARQARAAIQSTP
ncbi:MAG: membrane integrity-associated transporter subunit PqiC [Planctomycetes bacterium]|nr:membrane integrity-associated transporter subunit PqiC [Planctomycetota bacterium]